VTDVDRFLLEESDELAWETFHENSKTSRHAPHVYFGRHPSDTEVVDTMRRLREVAPHAGRDRLVLPPDDVAGGAAVRALLRERASARAFGAGPVTLADLAAVLRCGYGVTRDERAAGYPRTFRSSPSGGALYPLELFVWARDVPGLPPGLHHYDPLDDELDVLAPLPGADEPAGVDEPDGADLAAAFVQSDLVRSAAAVVLLSAVFFRSTFKYGDRGYRFVLLEAGHVAQNVVLAALSLGAAAVPLGGYFDREVDDLLGLNGIDESVVYAVALGRPAP